MPTFVPYFAYRDGAAALDWLVAAFGFEVDARHDSPGGGGLLHAELRYGADGRVMIGTATVEQPVPRPARFGIYVRVDDVDAHHDRALAAGAEVVLDPEDTEWGARQYRALDLDGFEWTFGSYGGQ